MPPLVPVPKSVKSIVIPDSPSITQDDDRRTIAHVKCQKFCKISYKNFMYDETYEAFSIFSIFKIECNSIF